MIPVSGDYSEGDPPVPIPNTEVKPFSGDNTSLATSWEDNTLPVPFSQETPLSGASFLFANEISLQKQSFSAGFSVDIQGKSDVVELTEILGSSTVEIPVP